MCVRLEAKASAHPEMHVRPPLVGFEVNEFVWLAVAYMMLAYLSLYVCGVGYLQGKGVCC